MASAGTGLAASTSRADVLDVALGAPPALDNEGQAAYRPSSVNGQSNAVDESSAGFEGERWRGRGQKTRRVRSGAPPTRSG
ncbi:hypothetical protein J2S43_001596 [Catenuloplanes nepalensis]|uniref:Uncharacterized protein n=1 Tax=Catenuloplanes nepalensis TaxID=587533 RepID=A0ABT9MNX5_9ACTN|nr:hypothetical protein [Catenuloplanes nepalensis]